MMVRKINIEQNKTIEAFQSEFSKVYPYLKIEFFTEPHVTGKGSAKNKMIRGGERLGAVQKIKMKGGIELSDQVTVGEFENIFKVKFGLYAQVFRKSGNIWLETSATDDWTLKQQNDEGKSLEQHLKVEKENPDDHDIY